jgi:hypothetical protein
MGQQVTEYNSPTPQSPPPIYAQPNPQVQQQPLPQFQQQPIAQQQQPTSPYPPSNYTELDDQNLQPARTSVPPPISPVGTYNSNATELGGSNIYESSPSPPVSQFYQAPPNIQQMGTYQQQPASTPGPQQPPYQPLNVQEMSGNATYQQQPVTQQQGYQPPTNIQEMSGGAASIRPVQSGGFDMSGAPMSENYGHHELP